MAIIHTIAASVAAIFLAGVSINVTEPILLAQSAVKSPSIAVGSQYDTTHVYLGPEDFDRFVASWTATFGGTTSKQVVLTVTPTPSSTISQLVCSPVGNLSVFGFKTPIPFPFGAERILAKATASGATVLVAPYLAGDRKAAMVQFPGGCIAKIHAAADATANK